MKKYFLYIILIPLMMAACTSKRAATTEVEHPAFSADTAYRLIEHQVKYGPRVPGSKAHLACGLFLVNMLHNAGAEVEIQQGTLLNYAGEEQTISNIIGRFGDISASNRILLCAHYDSRPWSDEEADYDARYLPVPAANDGASGVGVLLEIARQISKDTAWSKPVDIVFFDCEDMGTPSFYTGTQREDTWCLGSQLWARRMAQSGHNRDYQMGVLLDMVGAPDATFPKEYYSMQTSADYVEKLWRQAARLGYGRYFVSNAAYPIVDDHYYVSLLAGIPCLDIIHYDMTHETGFPAWWHTQADDMRNIDTATLQAVGEVVMSLIQ